MPSSKLTPKQQSFVDEYLVDLNGTQAAIRAGYSKKTANRIATENLSKPVIQEAIQKAMADRSARTQITADRVLQELARLAFSDMRKLQTWGPTGVVLKASSELDDDTAACVAEVSQTISDSGGSIKLKVHDKLSALEKIGKHLGMFKDKVELTGKDGGPIQVEEVSDAKQRLAERLARINQRANPGSAGGLDGQGS